MGSKPQMHGSIDIKHNPNRIQTSTSIREAARKQKSSREINAKMMTDMTFCSTVISESPAARSKRKERRRMTSSFRKLFVHKLVVLEADRHTFTVNAHALTCMLHTISSREQNWLGCNRDVFNLFSFVQPVSFSKLTQDGQPSTLQETAMSAISSDVRLYFRTQASTRIQSLSR